MPLVIQQAISQGTFRERSRSPAGRSYQFYAHLVSAAGGKLSTTHYDMIPNAAFAAGCSCHVPANKCSAFSPTLQTESGLDADGNPAQFFTREGATHHVPGPLPR